MADPPLKDGATLAHPRTAAPDPLAQAYDQLGARLYSYALILCSSHALAEDALQQAFAKLAALGGRIAEVQSLEHYLRVAVRNECYRLLQSPRLTAIIADAPALLEPVDAGLLRGEQRRAIERALTTLPAEQREIVHLKVYDDQTFEQIAEILGISPNTAASRYRYALEKLRQRLAAHKESAP